MYQTRDDFGKLFQKHYNSGSGVEIGVQNGYNSERIWKHWIGGIIMVDRWDNPEELGNCIKLNWDKKYRVLAGDSIEMASKVPDNSQDWIYIDAGHSYEEVKADFEAWYPKVISGGIVSGHDYGDNGFGVKKFIDEYIQLHPEVKMNFTTEDFWEGKEYQSWWFVKQ